MTGDRISPNSLRFERLLEAPIEKVWQYLVDPDLRSRWFMAGPTDLKVGGSFGMTMDHDKLSDEDVPIPEKYREYDGNSWSERITRYEPPRVLAITWEDGEAGEVTFELSEAEENTLLVLTHTGLRGRKDAVNFGGGWHSHLAVLQKRLAGKAVPNFWVLHSSAEAEMEKVLG